MLREATARPSCFDVSFQLQDQAVLAKLGSQTNKVSPLVKAVDSRVICSKKMACVCGLVEVAKTGELRTGNKNKWTLSCWIVLDKYPN